MADSGTASPDAADTTVEIPRCPANIETGQACSVATDRCTYGQCVPCSGDYWRLVRSDVVGFCTCDQTGVWVCPPLPPPGEGPGIVECIFDLPLECAIAEVIYEDPACQIHPACEP